MGDRGGSFKNVLLKLTNFSFVSFLASNFDDEHLQRLEEIGAQLTPETIKNIKSRGAEFQGIKISESIFEQAMIKTKWKPTFERFKDLNLNTVIWKD